VTPASDEATVDVTTTSAGEHFGPHVTWVNPGGTVTLVNGSGSYTATAYHPPTTSHCSCRRTRPRSIPDY
jgi:plastocyanin